MYYSIINFGYSKHMLYSDIILVFGVVTHILTPPGMTALHRDQRPRVDPRLAALRPLGSTRGSKTSYGEAVEAVEGWPSNIYGKISTRNGCFIWEYMGKSWEYMGIPSGYLTK